MLIIKIALMVYVHGYESKWIISSLSIDTNETECDNFEF